MKRKALTLALILLLTVSFASCSSTDSTIGDPGKPDVPAVQNGNPEDDTTDTPNGEDEKQSETTVDEGQTDEQQEEEQPPAAPAGSLIAIIDNRSEARPQAGLENADLVFEVECEYAITRYVALFRTRGAARVGPIRSARYYMLELAKPYRAPVAHAGGNLSALNAVEDLAIPDLDAIYNAGPYFWRDQNRQIPHNLYSSTKVLEQGARARGLTLSKEDFRWTQTEIIAAENAGTLGAANDISITYKDRLGTYHTKYSYQRETGTYQKYVEGQPYLSEAGAAITPANVIVLVTDVRPVRREQYELEIDVVGTGEAYFFTGGKAYRGRWSKESPAQHIRLFTYRDAVEFSPGQTWVNIVSAEGDVVCYQ